MRKKEISEKDKDSVYGKFRDKRVAEAIKMLNEANAPGIVIVADPKTGNICMHEVNKQLTLQVLCPALSTLSENLVENRDMEAIEAMSDLADAMMGLVFAIKTEKDGDKFINPIVSKLAKQVREKLSGDMEGEEWKRESNVESSFLEMYKRFIKGSTDGIPSNLLNAYIEMARLAIEAYKAKMAIKEGEK